MLSSLLLREYFTKNYLFFILFYLIVFTGNTLAQMTVEDNDLNILMEVSDEGTVGSIVLPDTNAAPTSTLNKLYNLGGTLNWNGSPLALGGSSNGWTIEGNNMYSNITDNVGIGATIPQFKLHLRQVSQFPITMGMEWIQPVIGEGGDSDWFYYSVGGSFILQGGTDMVRNTGSSLRFSVQEQKSSGPIIEQMRLTSNGKLGVGTTNPYQKLEVKSSDDTKDAASRFINDNGTILDIGVSGSNSGSGAGNENPYIYTNSKDLRILTGAGIVRVNGIFSNGADVIAGNGGGVLVSGGGKINIMDENGNGPIISLDPTQNNRKITTPILEITGGSDIAEPFNIVAYETIKPGMVVVIDPKNPGLLRIADRAYDRTVAGIVSGANGIRPGMTMSQVGTVANGSHPVALIGRVYVCADASNGKIKPGDLLTTSDTPGHAMKVTDYTRAQGSILGKAMTSLAKGRGFILVLVSLQ
jgi:hypothetical protein